jgi:hypothetical protein
LATAVAFDNGDKRAVILSLDLIGMNMKLMERFRSLIASAIGTEKEGVFIHCTHTHTGPTVAPKNAETLHAENEQYMQYLEKKLQDVAVLRMENPGASLQELADMCDPPMKKSGLNNRLRKIAEIADKL